MTDTLINLQAGSDTAPLRAKWGWIVALGVVYLVVGFIALGSVVMEELGVIRKNVERARQECETARLRFEQHIQQHGC